MQLRLLALLSTAPLAWGAALSVNGNCQAGSCASPDTVMSGGSRSTAFNFVIVLPNSDQYRIYGDINSSAGSAADPTFSIISPFTVTYIGNAAGRLPPPTSSTWMFCRISSSPSRCANPPESAQGAFGGALGAGSSVQVQLLIGGQALPVMGPFPAPASFSFKSQSYSLNPLSNTAEFDVHHIFTFRPWIGRASIYNANASTTPGSMAGSTVPTACDESSSDQSGCAIIACDGREQLADLSPRARPAWTRPRQARAASSQKTAPGALCRSSTRTDPRAAAEVPRSSLFRALVAM